MLLVLLACTPPPAAPDTHVERPSQLAVRLTGRAGDPHSATLHVDAPMDVTCAAVDGSDPRPALVVTADVTLRALLADTPYQCTGLTEDGRTVPSNLFLPAALPETLPPATLVQPDETAGWHLVNLVDNRIVEGNGGWLVILDEAARVRWALRGARFPGGLDATWMDQRVLFGGDGIAPTIVDLDGNVTWRAADTLGSPTEKPEGWNHDAGPSADGASIYALSNENLVNDDGSHTLGFVVKQLSLTDGSLEWSWGALEEGAGELDPTGTDPFHANAIWDDGELLLVNLRNTSQVLGIERSTGAIRWRLGRDGDFTLLEADGAVADPERWFLHEHDTKLVDGLLYVFDNSLEFSAPTRALVLAIDQDARTARIVREWTRTFDGEPWHALGWGGVDPLPDGGLSIAFGSLDLPPSGLYHIGPSGDTITWQVDFPESVGLYRSDRLDPFYVSEP